MNGEAFKQKVAEADGFPKMKHQPSENEAEGTNISNPNGISSEHPDVPFRKYENRPYIHHRKSGSRRKHKKLTVNKVRLEAERILEEFLQDQLHKQSIQTSSPEKRYERYVEVDITEGTTPSGSSTGYLASSSNYLRGDSIPFADASEEELRKADSLPHDEFLAALKESHKVADSNGLEIIHGKSKSAPYPHVHDVNLYKDSAWKYMPPPPPPPGTPHAPSEEGSSGKSATVPYLGDYLVNRIRGSTDSIDVKQKSPRDHAIGQQSTGSSSIRCSSDPLDVKQTTPRGHVTPAKTGAKVPSSLELPQSSMSPRSQKSSSGSLPLSDHTGRSSSPQKLSSSFSILRRLKRSGSLSSSDSSNDEGHHNLRGRKKKTMFKKAQERLSLMLRLNKAKSEPEEDAPDVHSKRQKKIKKPTKKPPKKPKKVRKTDRLDDEKWIDENDVVEERHTHIDKHIHQSHEDNGAGMVYRTEDTTETLDVMSDGETKHLERHVRVKQSSDSGTGFLGKLKRITGFNKESAKGAIKESKSEHAVRPLDNHPHNYSRGVSVPGGYRVTSVTSDSFDDHNHVNAVEVISQGDLSRHSSHIDIVDHEGSVLDRLFFEENSLPRNKSFDFYEEMDITEKRLREGDHVRVVRDVSKHDHMEQNLEMDGDQALGKEETEDLYNRVAGRLAEIGDNWMTEKELEQSRRSSGSSPRSKVTIKTGDEPSSQHESVIKKQELSLLEAEIRDELRLVADNVDARLAASARSAALQIAGIATYQKFKDTVQDSVGNEVGWAQVAAVFSLTKRAMQLAGGSGALAMQIRDNSLKFISDKFAQWIVDQGGWDSLVSDGSSSSSETELD